MPDEPHAAALLMPDVEVEVRILLGIEERGRDLLCEIAIANGEAVRFPLTAEGAREFAAMLLSAADACDHLAATPAPFDPNVN